MVTQPGREGCVRDSVECFAQQSYVPRELVIVHDGDTKFDGYLKQLIEQYAELDIKIVWHPEKASLGVLRNVSIAHAQHEVICQWDDDDLYHPLRLEKQYAFLIENNAELCFLGDQLHYFYAQQFLFWDDWSKEKFPNNLIQGTMLGFKNGLGEYPSIARGEDTDLVFRLAKEDKRFAILNGLGWLYVYTYHGANAWEEGHHKAIAGVKRLTEPELEKHLSTLNDNLQAYAWKFQRFYMPHESGGFEINLETAAQ